MTSRNALEERLARLAETGIAGPEGRLVRAGDAAALRRRLLRHLDAVVLPRAVEIAVGKHAFTFDLANRRILRVEGVAARLEGTEVTPEAVATLLDGLVAGACEATLRTASPSGAAEGSGTGISVATLASAMGVSLVPADEPTAIHGLLARAGALAGAWLLRSDGVIESTGPDHLTERLLSRMPAESGDGEPWRLLALHWSDGQAAVYVLQGPTGLALAVQPDAIAQVCDLWRGLVDG